MKGRGVPIIWLILTVKILGLIFYVESRCNPYGEFRTIPIISYHRFEPRAKDSYAITPEVFESHLKFLRNNGYTVIKLSLLVDYLQEKERGITPPSLVLPPKPVVITIDDGYKSVYTHGYPLLKRYGYPATIFIYTDFIGKEIFSLTWEEIKEMCLGGMEIGSHTKSHSILTKWKKKRGSYQEWLRKEILGSKQIIEQQLGIKVSYLAYPYGVYDDEIERVAIESGYKGIVTTNDGVNTDKSSRFRLKRQLIHREYAHKFPLLVSALPLDLVSLTPPDGSTVNSRHPIISATLDSYEEVNIWPLEMTVARKSVSYEYDKFTRQMTYLPLKPLRRDAIIVTISGMDRILGRLRQASWLFTIREER